MLSKIFLPAGADTADPAVRARAGKACGVLGICANGLLFAIKLLAGILSGSVAITADAMNNFSDAGSAVVTLAGFKLAEKPADRDHPYGHARYEYLSALAVAVMILLIGLELGKSALQKILSPQPVRISALSIGILVFSIAVKLGLWAVNRSVGKKIDSVALAATAVDCRNDVLATAAVLLTGLASRAGLQADGWAGLGVAVFIAAGGWRMVRSTVSTLLGEADPQLQEQIIACLQDEKILGYHDLMVHDYGPGQRFASIHVQMDMREDPLTCHAVIDDIERRCYEQHRVHLVIHHDPIVTDDLELNLLRRRLTGLLLQLHPKLSYHDLHMKESGGEKLLRFEVALPQGVEEAAVRRGLQALEGEYRLDVTFEPKLSGSRFSKEFDS